MNRILRWNGMCWDGTHPEQRGKRRLLISPGLIWRMSAWPFFLPPPAQIGKELWFPIEADEWEISNYNKEDVQDSIYWDRSLGKKKKDSSHHHLESLHHVSKGQWDRVAFPANPHPCFSSNLYPEWTIEQMVLRKLAYNMEKMKLESFIQIWTLDRSRTKMWKIKIWSQEKKILDYVLVT